ncbi:MAG: hypothetical protein U0R51_14025 [Solirubrobacterales bacterium]
MASYKLTIRNGPKVTREKYESLDEAIAAMREHTERIRADGDLPEISVIRTYEPGDQVKARLEISTGGVLRSRDAGIDVMGDGALVPFRGGVFRKEIAPGDDAYEVIAQAIAGEDSR